MKRVLLALLLVLSVAPSIAAQGQVTPLKGPCYMVLEDLAHDKQTERWVTGGIYVGAGVLIYLAFAPYEPTVGLILGGIPLGIGAFTLLVPSDAERAFTEVQRERPETQEMRCDIVLTKLAHSARRSRYINGIECAALGIAGLALGDIYSGTLGLGMAAFNFFFPSLEETALEEYRQLTSSSLLLETTFCTGVAD